MVNIGLTRRKPRFWQAPQTVAPGPQEPDRLARPRLGDNGAIVGLGPQRSRPIARNFSWRCRRIASGLWPENSPNALATASPARLNIIPGSRCAPPVGSVMMTSITPNVLRSWAVIFMLVAASMALAESRHRMEAAASGEATV